MADHCTLEIPLMGPMVLRTPFSEGLVTDLKAEVPPYAREWDPDRKAWEISDAALRPLVERIVLKHFPSLQVLTVDGEDQIVDRLGRATQARLLL
jgi:hypothetical protein